MDLIFFMIISSERCRAERPAEVAVNREAGIGVRRDAPGLGLTVDRQAKVALGPVLLRQQLALGFQPDGFVLVFGASMLDPKRLSVGGNDLVRRRTLGVPGVDGMVMVMVFHTESGGPG